MGEETVIITVLNILLLHFYDLFWSFILLTVLFLQRKTAFYLSL